MVDYPQTVQQWRTWVRIKVGVSEEDGFILVKKNVFPKAALLQAWQIEFSTENGYSPDFIPALSRNIVGFLQWVYDEGDEPNWKMSDNESE